MHLRGWDEVTPGVHVHTSRLDSATTTAIIAGREVVLVDPNWTPDELAAQARSLSAAGLVVVAGLSTHAHHDHVLWHPGFGDAPRYASTRTVELAAALRPELVDALGPDFPAGLVALVGELTPLPDAPIWSGPTLEFLIHDAHAPGHTAIWLPEQQVLIAGDMLSDQELPLLDEGGVRTYAAGLTALRPVAEHAAVIIPGHGAPGTDAATRWTADYTYLHDLVTGRDSTDPRLAHPGMTQVHAEHLDQVR